MTWKPLPMSMVDRTNEQAITDSRQRIQRWIDEHPGWQLDEYSGTEYRAVGPRVVPFAYWVITVKEIE